MTRHPHFWLLLSLLVTIILSPIFEHFVIANLIVGILFTMIVVTSLNAASDRRSHKIIAWSLAVPWILVNWSGLFFGAVEPNVPANLIAICLLFFTIYVLLGALLDVRETDIDVLSAAISTYLLIAIAWALSYEVMEALLPGSFATGGADAPLSWSQFLYFSLTTVTTLGYGDIAPATAIAGIWATLEAVAGLLYIAVLVARLVSLLRR